MIWDDGTDNHWSEAVQKLTNLPVNFAAGFSYPLRALGLLSRSPQLWVNVALPILLNVVLGGVLYVSLLLPGWQTIDRGVTGLPNWLAQRVAEAPAWLARWLAWLPTGASVVDDLLRWLLAIALFIVTGLLLVQFGAILGAPWYGNLAEQIEKLQLGKLPTTTPSFSRALQDIWRAITFQLKKLVLAIGLGVPIFLLNFVPVPIVSTTIASLAGVALAAFLVGIDFLDPFLERRRLSFRQKLAIFGRSLPGSGTFSWVCLILVSIPLLNLVMVPICIVAGTLFCCDRILPALPASNPEV
jgi:CysZ protein